MSSIRKRQALESYRSSKRRKTSRTKYQGLVPTYRGFTPRAFRRGEWKYVDTSLGFDINTGALGSLLNGLQPGSSASQRIGMNCEFKSLEFRARVTSTAATGVDQYCRMLIVQDKQSNGVAPGIGDILINASTTAPRNLANRKRFRILWDKTFAMGGNLNAAGTPSTVPNLRNFKAYMKFRPAIRTEYNTGVAGTIADINSNSLYLVTIGTEAAGATDAGLVGYIRLRYTDM